MTMPSPPDGSGIAGDNVWDSGKWGSSSWGDVTPSSITQQWESLSGLGYTCSISFQVTSGTSAPIDAELISLEMLTTTNSEESRVGKGVSERVDIGGRRIM